MKNSPENPFLQAALTLAKKGFEVFPVTANEKSPPLVKFTTDSTADPHKIKIWWERFPNANIGIHCKGKLVVDIDVDKGGSDSALDLELGGHPFPETLEQVTPSGGSHLIYTADEKVHNSVSKLATGIDIRSDHGYILGAGSVTSKGIYRLKNPDFKPQKAPIWIYHKLRSEPKLQPSTKTFETPDPVIIKQAINYLSTQAIPALEGDAGRKRLFQVAATATEKFRLPLETLKDLFAEHYNPRCEPPWTPEQSYDFFNILSDAHSKSQFVRPSLKESFEPIGSVTERTVSLFSHQSKMESNLMTVDLVHGVLSQNSLATLVGPSNVGKTSLALDLAFSVARGTPWLNKYEALPGTAVYIGLESSQEDIARRVHAYRCHYPETGNAPLYLLTKSVDLSTSSASGWHELLPAVKALQTPENPIRLVIVDTLARALSGADENSAKDMGAFLKACDKLRELTGACVLIVHHTGKDTERGGRGSSALHAGIDTELRVSDNKCITAAKQRAMAKGGMAIYYDLLPIELGMNPKGKPVTACIVTERKPGAVETFSGATDEAKEAEQVASYIGRGMWAIQKAFAESLNPEDPMAEVKSIDEERVWEIIKNNWYADKSDSSWRGTKSQIRQAIKDHGIKINKGRIYRGINSGEEKSSL